MMHLPDRRQPPTVLVVDDEPDVHQVTRITLRSLRFENERVRFVSAHSAAEALETLRQRPDIAVVLLDVVMERDDAGLVACDAIRGELGNPFVRILLRTGQPGQAPERETIDRHDLDGYLPKGELTSSRLYAAVRTALRSWRQLVDLERHNRSLVAIAQCTASLHACDEIEANLERVLDSVFSLAAAPMVLLSLQTHAPTGHSRRFSLFRTVEGDGVRASLEAERLTTLLRAHVGQSALEETEHGVLLPLRLHRDIGRGFILLRDLELDEVARASLPLLAAQVANALYAAVAHAAMRNETESVFGDILV